eukprot:m.97228 g.97228  ORF g.97228 m.97228 type:complete len:550 (+) comp8984_c1_seq1:86-1735(+)
MSSQCLVLSIDQGTSSTRCGVWTNDGQCIASHQIPLQSLFPQSGWVEQDPSLVFEDVMTCIEVTCKNLVVKGIPVSSIKSIGITNQRETTIAWDKESGKPLHNAIVWSDTRTTPTVERLIAETPTNDKCHFQKRCGLPISTYFSAVKIRWLLDNVDVIRLEANGGRCMFGTMDTWLIWHLTGGISGGKYVTDVTNASRTMLMNINTLEWDSVLCKFFGVKMDWLPTICSSAEVYGNVAKGVLKGIPIAACLGDQHAALVGQKCFRKGEAKNTYGTGCFLLSNTGKNPVFSRHGLLTTVGYKLGKDQKCVYALEGSVAVAGSCITWLRDNLNIIEKEHEVEKLASSVANTAGVYFVPAFSGLLAPHWRPDARGIIVGLSHSSTKAHIARAALEAVCFQTREVLEAMAKDCTFAISSLRVDGGMTNNSLMLQFQADILGVPVLKPHNIETTSFGAALAAGLHVGWSLEENNDTVKELQPKFSVDERDEQYARWKAAVQRSLGWERGTTRINVIQPSMVKKQPSNPIRTGVMIALGVAGVLVAVFAYNKWKK